MFRSIATIWLLSLSLLPIIIAQSTCSATSKCPASAPCCSEYGFCGVAGSSYCQQGCEPLHSNTLTSCRPNPLCQSQSTNFPANLDRLQMNATKFNGNASAYDWVLNAGYAVPTSDGLRLTLNQTNSGTKISSTKYIQYGQIDFTMQTSKWAGVVTAAITMSDVKDEIDWEWTGTATSEAQTNIWFLGIADYANTKGEKVQMGTDTSQGFHTYTLNWQPDYLQWLIDGRVVRTINRSDTLNAATGRYEYPTTPSRIQLSIWPGGIPSSAQGTIDWAGGLIQYNEPEYVQNGYYWNTIKAITVKCAATANVTAGTKGWAYMGNTSLSVPYVATTNASTMLSAGMREAALPVNAIGAVALVAAVAGAISTLL